MSKVNYSVAMESETEVLWLQALLSERQGGRLSIRRSVSWAVQFGIKSLEKNGAMYDQKALGDLMRQKTIAAVAENLQAALRAFDREATYSVVSDVETGNIEITQNGTGREARTVILMERRANLPPKGTKHDERAENHAQAVGSALASQ